MATYIQLRNILAREGTPRRFTYLCGTSQVLVEQAVDALKTACAAEEFVSLSADHDDSATIWSEINQHALDADDVRLVLIRQAHKLQGWEQFEDWLNSRVAPNVKVVMVSTEASWPMHRHTKLRNKMVRSTQSVYAECSLPKTNPEKAAVEIIRGWSTLSKEQAAYLAKRTGFNLARCRDVCQWLGMLPGQPSTQLIDELAAATPADSYVAALVRLDRVTASTLAQNLSRGETASVIGVLSARLLDLDRIHRVMGKTLIKGGDAKRAKSDTARLSEVKLDRVIELWDAARHYGAKEIQRRTELLVMADESRGQIGVLERLALQW